MKLRIDDWVGDKKLGRLKFLGYDNGLLLFRAFSLSFRKWEDSGFTSFTPTQFQSRVKAGLIRKSYAPK